MTAAVVLSVLLTCGCQELRDEELDITPPEAEDIPPFLVSAPDLQAANHPTGWQRLDCETCHTKRLTPGHEFISQERCVKCHGYNGSPTVVGCGECHDVPNPAGFPLTGLHDFHVSDKAFGCDECHNDNTHRNGGLDVALKQGGAFYRDIADLPGDSALFAGEGCSDAGCHESRAWNVNACETCHESPPPGPSHELHLTARATPDRPALTCRDCHAENEHDDDLTSGSIEVGGPEWADWKADLGTCQTSCHVGEEKQWTCDTCHEYPSREGSHPPHVEGFQLGCSVCHAGHEHSFAAAIDPLNQTGLAEVSFLPESGEWDPVARSCANVSCHEPRTWGEDACASCHQWPPSGPDHELHLAVRGGPNGLGLTCRDCHANNQHDDDLMSGAIDVGGPEWIDWRPDLGSCGTTCHGGEQKQWTCDTCHGYPPDVGAHKRHAEELVLECRVCYSNHEHSSEAVADPLNQTGKVEISFILQRGEWNPVTRTCSDVGCHGDRLWP